MGFPSFLWHCLYLYGWVSFQPCKIWCSPLIKHVGNGISIIGILKHILSHIYVHTNCSICDWLICLSDEYIYADASWKDQESPIGKCPLSIVWWIVQGLGMSYMFGWILSQWWTPVDKMQTCISLIVLDRVAKVEPELP